MKDKIAKQLEDLNRQLADLVTADDPAAAAAWKIRRKIQAALDILNHEWPGENGKVTKLETQNSKPKTGN